MYKDQVITTGILSGNKRIINYFYEENIRYIRGYIQGNCGNTEDVEDVFQDALVVLYEKLQSGNLELRVPLKTYFYGICKNVWRNRLRKTERLIIDDEYYRLEQRTYDNHAIHIENQEREYLYKKHFDKLSAENQNLLYLFFEGRSMREISEIMGHTEGYTRKKKFDAKKRLLAMIEKDPMYNELKAVC